LQHDFLCGDVRLECAACAAYAQRGGRWPPRAANGRRGGDASSKSAWLGAVQAHANATILGVSL